MGLRAWNLASDREVPPDLMVIKADLPLAATVLDSRREFITQCVNQGESHHCLVMVNDQSQ